MVENSNLKYLILAYQALLKVVFDSDKQKVQELKDHYQKGGWGDVKVKKYLFEVLENVLEPIRSRRSEFAKDPGAVMDMLKKGVEKTRQRAAVTMEQVRQAMKINYF